jgi:hypothetical protein
MKKSLLAKVGHLSLAFVLATSLALLSVLVERTGPELEQYGNLCGSGGNDPCYQPVLKGGFPVARVRHLLSSVHGWHHQARPAKGLAPENDAQPFVAPDSLRLASPAFASR